MFKRRNLFLQGFEFVEGQTALESEESSDTPRILPQPAEQELKVLVVNSSHEMAKEITMQLTLNLPGCSITYAPTLQLATWILQRREIDLVVSSPILPDGSITRLKEVLSTCRNQPDVVVVTKVHSSNIHLLKDSGYHFAAYRRLGKTLSKVVRQRIPEKNPDSNQTTETIKALGADLRNDLNNPLQEIVAMVFVAKAAGASAPSTNQALEAIDKAAQNMAQVVNDLEGKIRDAVLPAANI